MVALAFRAPAAGRLWIVPLGTAAAAGLPARLVDGGALFLGEGPIAGSWIVIGDRARIDRALAGRRVLTLAAPPAACDGAKLP